jgi:hypothetical protein
MTVTRVVTRAAVSAVAVVGVVLAAATPADGSAAPTAAATRYVAPGGHDGTNTCLVKAIPCATISHALSEAASGDTISLAKGTYDESGLVIRLAVTITGSGAATTVIDGTHTNGVFAVTSGGSLDLVGVTVQNGMTTDHGGAILNDGTLTLSRDSFKHNKATDPGGAINNYTTITSITDCSFSRSYTTSNGAGGIENFGTIGPITDSVFARNNADGLGAGAIDNDGSIASIDNDLFIENTSAGDAGAVDNGFGEIGDISGDSFVRNVSVGGIAGALENIFGSIDTMTNDTFADNSALGELSEGGAMLNDEATIGLMADDTFTGNSAGFGGGLDNEEGGFINSMTDTIFSDNTASQGPNCYFFSTGGDGGIVDTGYNLLGDTSNSCGFSTAKHDLIDISADLQPVGHYDGTTLTTPPAPGSPVIDAGGPAPCPTAADEVGTPRPQGPACDIGAIEYVAQPTSHRIVHRGDRR